jgi:hypothetical protein
MLPLKFGSAPFQMATRRLMDMTRRQKGMVGAGLGRFWSGWVLRITGAQRSRRGRHTKDH